MSAIYMGDTPLGPFESQSIMSYCRSNPGPTLTQEDINMTLSLYGSNNQNGIAGTSGSSTQAANTFSQTDASTAADSGSQPDILNPSNEANCP